MKMTDHNEEMCLSTDLVTSKIFDIQNTLRIQLFQTKKRAPRSQLDTLDFLADRNSKQLPAQPFNGTLCIPMNPDII